jgi:hypothetical protein
VIFDRWHRRVGTKENGYWEGAKRIGLGNVHVAELPYHNAHIVLCLYSLCKHTQGNTMNHHLSLFKFGASFENAGFLSGNLQPNKMDT